jgi:hypothetical protein
MVGQHRQRNPEYRRYIRIDAARVKLVTSGNSVDVANEINDLVNKLQIEKPNISYAELTDVLVAAYCPAAANMANLTAS